MTRTFSKAQPRLLRYVCFGPWCALLLAAWTAAAAPTAPPTLAVRTDLVRVEVSVLDSHRQFAGGLTRRDFYVLDDGAPRPIVLFTPAEAPARIVVMIETSPAVYLIHDQHLAAAYALLEGLNPADQVALVTYSDRPRQALSFTTHPAALLDALNSLQYTIGMGALNFYDSLSSVLEGLKNSAGKTAIVLLTTGLDSSPVSHWSPLVRQLHRSDVVVFPVALGGELRDSRSRKTKRAPQAAAAPDSLDHLQGFARADRALGLLAKITGGQAYFPKSDRDFPLIYREIAQALRHQYVLAITPAHDGRFHALTVGVASGTSRKKPNKRYRVLAREGYIAPTD